MLKMLVFTSFTLAGAVLYAEAPHTGPDLTLVLPDQAPIEVYARPALQEKKLSTIELKFTPTSVWIPLALDAEMPAHKHGMVVTPSIPKPVAGRPGIYEVRGVKLHMAGAWDFKLKIRNSKSGEEQWISRALILSL